MQPNFSCLQSGFSQEYVIGVVSFSSFASFTTAVDLNWRDRFSSLKGQPFLIGCITN